MLVGVIDMHIQWAAKRGAMRQCKYTYATPRVVARAASWQNAGGRVPISSKPLEGPCSESASVPRSVIVQRAQLCVKGETKPTLDRKGANRPS